MDRDGFWEIIEKGKHLEDPQDGLEKELSNLSPEEIVSFEKHFRELFQKAYKWDLWGGAYIMDGGCSDDGFMDFRYGLISLGQERYEKALEDPDSLADIPEGKYIPNELFGYVASTVYEEKTKDTFPDLGSSAPSEPEGEEWDFDDEAESKKRLPRLFEKFWDSN